MSLILLSFACQHPVGDSSSFTGESGTPGTTDTTTTTTDTTDTTTDGTTDTSSTLPAGLHGEAPAVALAAPDFDPVSNRDGAQRTKADLVDGRPTVMWFYPAAGTSG